MLRRSRPSHAALPATLLLVTLGACSGERAEEGPDASAGPAAGEAPDSVTTIATADDVDRARAALPPGAEAVSFLGVPLAAPALGAEARATHEENLAAAEADLAAAPGDADALIWYGRRLAYLGRYRDAIETYTQAIELHPEDARLYRHRGHRWLTVREPGRAVADFRKAVELIDGTEDEVEPDGLPNALGIPTSTLHFNIYYHLGLAHYLRGEFPQALLAWNECMEVSEHDDSVVATAYWLNNVLRRLDMDERAGTLLEGIDEEMEIIESTSYLDVLLLWKGAREPDDLRSAAGEEGALAGATTEYGIGMWHFANGEREHAYEIWETIVDTRRDQWASFGYMAAEAELARVGTTGGTTENNEEGA